MPKYIHHNSEGRTEVTEKFLQAMDHMIYSKKVKNRREFAKLVGTAPHQITGMQKGTRYVTIDMLWQLNRRYPEYMGTIFPNNILKN